MKSMDYLPILKLLRTSTPLPYRRPHPHAQLSVVSSWSASGHLSLMSWGSWWWYGCMSNLSSSHDQKYAVRWCLSWSTLQISYHMTKQRYIYIINISAALWLSNSIAMCDWMRRFLGYIYWFTNSTLLSHHILPTWATKLIYTHRFVPIFQFIFCILSKLGTDLVCIEKPIMSVNMENYNH